MLGKGFGTRGGGLVCAKPFASIEGSKSLYGMGMGGK